MYYMKFASIRLRNVFQLFCVWSLWFDQVWIACALSLSFQRDKTWGNVGNWEIKDTCYWQRKRMCLDMILLLGKTLTWLQSSLAYPRVCVGSQVFSLTPIEWKYGIVCLIESLKDKISHLNLLIENNYLISSF